MHSLIPYLWAAGAVQLLIAAANFFAPRKLHYRENLAKVSPIVREIFIVQNVYIVFTLVAYAAMCFLFAGDLAGGSTLGRSFSGFLAIFWGGRLCIQICIYDADIKRKHPVFHVCFALAFLYLTGVFTLAVAGL
ncbi:MAG: hypothetical protein K2R98_32360 [Gemmataceae bacterium]|nr:hypothetical protein [Gemmataceae bacterium]